MEERSGSFLPELPYTNRGVIRLSLIHICVMWQTVISFDNRWLEQNGIYDSQKQILDEQKLKEVTRLAVNRLLKSEGLEPVSYTHLDVYKRQE